MSLWMGALVRSMQPDSGHNPILEAAAYSDGQQPFLAPLPGHRNNKSHVQ